MESQSHRAGGVSRRRLLAGAAAAAFSLTVLRHRADAAEFNFKLGHDNPVDHPVNIRAVEAAEAILKASDGRLSIKVFPNNQLGNDTQMVAQIRSGALEFMMVGDNILANVIPVTNLAGLPFAYKGYDDLWTTLDGPFGQAIRAQINKTGIHAFDRGWDVGFRHVFTSDRAVKTVNDMAGLKLRVPEAPIQFALFKALGCSPTPVNNADLYTALQTHLVDGAEQPLISLTTAHYYEVSKYISLTRHMPTSWELLASGATWRRLPKALQDLVAGIFDETALKERADIAQLESKLEEQLRTKGQVILQPDIESFKAKVSDAGLYAKWRDAYGPDAFALLEKAVGKLA